MKLFACGVCGQPLMFENTSCVSCHHRLGYDVVSDTMVALDPLDDLWRPASGDTSRTFRFCANAAWDVCNWLIPSEIDAQFCRACVYNRTVPDANDPAKLRLWRDLEAAKHRLIFTLIKLDLPMPTRNEDPNEGLAFDFLVEEGSTKVLTGHDQGLVTLNAAEADVAARVKLREEMGEAYRTLLGHFRHEIGHYYWDRLVRDGPMLAECRSLFGDDTADYQQSLERHYSQGAPADWREHFVSAYATMHPWEDFAETFAHYLHIVDALDTARAFGMAVNARAVDSLEAEASLDPYRATSMEQMTAVWDPLCFAVNALNRSMGQPDLYPFVLPPAVLQKLEFMRRLVATAGGTRAEPQRMAA
mgnify:CR=1 FL=1